MITNFSNALRHVLRHEGGWSDHPKDPGGATMKGVTLLVYRRHFGADKGKNDLRQITEAQLEQVYRSGYWDKCHCDELPTGIDYVVFDAAVNSGPGRGAKWLQAAIGAKQDGGIGPNTLAKINAQNTIQITDDMCDYRLNFLKSLSNWSTFGGGWGRRVEGVRTAAIAMAEGNNPDINKSIPSVNYSIVKKGSTGSWVSKLQQALEIQVDGVFGEDTEIALKAWQMSNSLQPDGIASRNTYRSLGLIA